MTKLRDLPRDALVAATANSLVVTYRPGFDEKGRVVALKLVFADGRTATFCIASAAILILAERMEETARTKGWQPVEPRDEPDLEPADWDCAGKMVITWRAEAFDDGIILALQYAADLVQCVRLTPGHSAQLAADILEERQRGVLRDIRKETPPSNSAH